MNAMEKLWQEYLRAEYGRTLPPEGQLAAQRHAFFMGAWCQLVFNRKLRELDPPGARAAGDAIELELARVVSAAPQNVEPASASRLAA
jgi:hypothetical protein